MSESRDGSQYLKRPHRPRLASECYKGFGRYFITICTEGKKHALTSPAVIKPILMVMYDYALGTGFRITAYCVMPDHMHLLLEATRETSDLEKFVKIFKQKTSFQRRRKSGGVLWQKGYYDHVLRNDEDTAEVARYILNNPVRKGMVDDFALYPWIGSEIFDVRVM